MKILHVIPSLSAVHGGPTKAMYLIERALQKQNLHIETATTDDGLEKNNDKQQYANCPENGVIRHYFHKNTEFYKVSMQFAAWVFRNARVYDIIHIHALFSFTSIVAAWAARLMKIPYIIRPLGTLTHYGITQRRPWLKQLSLTMIEAPLLRHAAAVHFTSELEKQEAALLNIPMNGVVIPLGIEAVTTHSELLFKEHYPQVKNKTIVLYLSRLDPKKNIKGLLQAIALKKDNYQNTHLIIAGDGDEEYTKKLRLLAKNLEVDDHIIWTGRLEGDLKASAFSCSDIFILPSFSENFGIAVAEALMAGLPCVVGKGVAISKQIEDFDAGIVTDPTPESIAEGLTKLISNKPQRQKLSANAKKLAYQEFSIDTMGSRLVELYQNILSKNSHKSC